MVVGFAPPQALVDATLTSPANGGAVIGSGSKRALTSGEFSVPLGADLPAGGPYNLTVTEGENTITVNDVYVGELWLVGNL